VVKDYLPEEALYLIQYHSFCSCHRERAYEYLKSDRDRRMFEWVRAFTPTICTPRARSPPDAKALGPIMTV